jgi:hypothetical protein
MTAKKFYTEKNIKKDFGCLNPFLPMVKREKITGRLGNFFTQNP